MVVVLTASVALSVGDGASFVLTSLTGTSSTGTFSTVSLEILAGATTGVSLGGSFLSTALFCCSGEAAAILARRCL